MNLTCYTHEPWNLSLIKKNSSLTGGFKEKFEVQNMYEQDKEESIRIS